VVKRRLPTPTEKELELLKVLWRLGAATVREIHGALGRKRGTGYTTVLKQLQIMHRKGLVERDERQRSHVYRPCLSEADTERRMVSDILHRVFDGSASRLAMRALAQARTSPKELEELRRLLAELEASRPKR
jgi:predicted transcriptional regulator